MQDQNADVRWDRVKPAGVDDARAARLRGRVEPLDRLAHEKCLAGEIGVVGAGRGARLDERRAVTAIRPDRRGHCSGPCRELGERCAILGVRDDQRPIRRPSAKLFTDAFELLLRASGKADAHIVRRRARQILRRELADEPGGSVKHDVQLARGCHGPRMLPPGFWRPAGRRRQRKRRSQAVTHRDDGHGAGFAEPSGFLSRDRVRGSRRWTSRASAASVAGRRESEARRPAAAARVLGGQRNAGPRATSFSYTFCWIVSRTRSESSNTRPRSAAASGPYSEVSIGSQNSIRQREGSGTAPSGPSSGKVGVTGKYGAPNSRDSRGSSPTLG